ncbi:hypothetical protein [Sphingobium boeckii]|uniref:Uncharacterized protein n=1 Tax=Sphingobium boeckii TaxID=1082345 RepID=A0A7W9AEN1_9SPHN|nr:hypothetical protein [Sphingobium boeckii]MBB5684280.1 hypothetical protein [Sphingobium boeckii]
MNGLSQILKGISGEFELGRMLWAFMGMALVAYQGIDVFYNKQPFNPVEFGAGAAAILAAGGFGIAAKDKGVAKAAAETSAEVTS